MRVRLNVILDFKLYDLTEWRAAEAEKRARNGEIYSWHSAGRYNWLERGLSVADVLGLVILPKGLPDIIDMPEDEPEQEELQMSITNP